MGLFKKKLTWKDDSIMMDGNDGMNPNMNESKTDIFNPQNENGYLLTYNGKRYAFDIEKIKSICLVSSTQKDGETEITEVYGGEGHEDMELSSKIVRENRTQGNTQNDVIIYDMVKLFIVRLLENAEVVNEYPMTLDFSTSIALNTMLKWGLLIEVE